MNSLKEGIDSAQVLFQIGVLIATSFQRTGLLFGRSLASVLNQTYPPDFIVIIDDNQNENEFEEILEKTARLNRQNIFCIRNFKTKHHSGAGAWNSGIDFLREKFDCLDTGYIAILDDDDKWDSTYLEKCADQIKTGGTENTSAVFAGMVRLDKNGEIKPDLNKTCITVENFLAGNPGIQGSNMFFNMKSLLNAGGFDENLKSCTDRDLLIRFLKQNSIDSIALINETLVYHYAHNSNTVTNNPLYKQAGLDSFFSKYIHLFTAQTLEQSLYRAEKYFSYANRKEILNLYDKCEKIVLAIPARNCAKTIRRAVLSAARQKNLKRKLMLVIGDDNSTDKWRHEISDLISPDIIIINIEDGGKSYKARNFINDYILANMEKVAYIGRLDADDELADDLVISKMEQIIDNHNPDVIIAGNYQRKGNKITGRNMPGRDLLDSASLMERLRKMSLGDSEAELPSCNTFVKPEKMIKHHEKESAEDHWFTVSLLEQKHKLKIHIAEQLIYCIYSLGGLLTANNMKKEHYIKSRIELFEYQSTIVRRENQNEQTG